MSKDEIVIALRCCGNIECMKCRLPRSGFDKGACRQMYVAAADLIENQQRHIDALLQANAALRDTVLRRDAQIEKMSEGLAQFAKAVAEKEAIKDEPR